MNINLFDDLRVNVVILLMSEYIFVIIYK